MIIGAQLTKRSIVTNEKTKQNMEHCNSVKDNFLTFVAF